MLSSSAVLIGLSILATGLILGSIYALVAAGLTIVYGSMGLLNISSGQLFVFAALGAWSLATWLGMGLLPAIVIIVLISLPVSYLIQVLLLRRFFDVPHNEEAYMIVTLGLTQILTGILHVTYGRVSDQFTLPQLVGGISFIGPFPMQNNHLLVIGVALTMLAGLIALLRFHRYGRALRAVFQNREAAALRGVNVHRIYTMSFMLGMIILFVSGILYAMAYSFDLSVGWSVTLVAFAIMIIGGPGSVMGAVVIGMAFGFTQAAVGAFFGPIVATFSYLVMMLLVLLFRPAGLFVR